MKYLVLFLIIFFSGCSTYESGIPDSNANLIIERHRPDFNECVGQNSQLVWSGIDPNFIYSLTENRRIFSSADEC